MHHRLYITVSLPENMTSEGVRRAVYNMLMADNSFCGDGGRFGSPLCDWYVIGGRWSGLLVKTSLGEEYKFALESLKRSLNAAPRTSDPEHVKAKAFDALWCEHGGTGQRPETRDSYEELGYPDDAMLVTTKIYERLLAEYVGVDNAGHHYADLDGEELNPDFIGRKWIVVVDYHN